MNPEARLAELKLELPSAPKPVAVYKPLVICGNLAYASGHGPLKPDKTMMTGRVGQDLDLAGSGSGPSFNDIWNSAASTASSASSKCWAWSIARRTFEIIHK